MSFWSKLFGSPRDPVELEALMEELATALRPHMRRATRLVPSRVAEPAGGVGSRTGGTPYAEAEEEWPLCQGCQRPLDFVAQVDLRECTHRPTKAYDLFTLFYCWKCFPWGDEDSKDAGQWLVRTYVEPSTQKARELQPPAAGARTTKACQIQAFTTQLVPDWEELDCLDKELAQRLAKLPEFPDILEDLERKLIRHPIAEAEATWVGGLPSWVQGEDAPKSADGRRFELLVQLDSEPAPGWMWGDAGILYLFFDPDQPQDIRLLLQCH